LSARDAELKEFFTAIRDDKTPAHDGRWAQATLEVCLGILESSASGSEVHLRHQVRSRPPLGQKVDLGPMSPVLSPI
jgi:hypothetical protein